MEDIEVCTCGHQSDAHENGEGPCAQPGCPCQAYTQEVDDPSTEVEPGSQAA